jgi:hypothetical protein
VDSRLPFFEPIHHMSSCSPYQQNLGQLRQWNILRQAFSTHKNPGRPRQLCHSALSSARTCKYLPCPERVLCSVHLALRPRFLHNRRSSHIEERCAAIGSFFGRLQSKYQRPQVPSVQYMKRTSSSTVNLGWIDDYGPHRVFFACTSSNNLKQSYCDVICRLYGYAYRNITRKMRICLITSMIPSAQLKLRCQKKNILFQVKTNIRPELAGYGTLPAGIVADYSTP